MSRFESFDDGDLRILKIGPIGPYDNNAYLIRDVARGESLLVDMPVDDGILLAALEGEGGVSRIVVTHWHPDHWASYDAVRSATGAPVLVGDKEILIPEERIDGRLADGDTVPVGSHAVEVLHTPGHTPGSISLRIGRALISGDTLFNGGPGKTFAQGDLEVLVRSIVDHLHPLPEDTIVLPGHGSTTTIGVSRRQYAEYVKRPHTPGYFGDVDWLVGAG